MPSEDRSARPGRRSAGILLWRRNGRRLEVLLAHPGGPYFARKDAGHWTVVKGEIEPDEDPASVAQREFAEETGQEVPEGPRAPLGEIRQAGGKVVTAWAVEGDLDPEHAVSNEFEMEWPPRSGRMQEFPEIDRVEWFDLPTARTKIMPAQSPFIDRLEQTLGTS
jgi:predicted NUDIX family NTP pyrophosphohydrolase